MRVKFDFLAMARNLVENGNGENGTCATNKDIVSPTYWNFSGPVSQVKYDTSGVSTDADLTCSSVGPR